MHAVSASTSSGSIAGNMPDAQLVAAELAVGLDVDDAVRAQRRGDLRRRRRTSSKSIVPTTSERFAGSATNGVGERGALGPAVEVRADDSRRALHAPVQAAVAVHPVDLVGEQQQRRDAPACCRSGPCAEFSSAVRERQELGDPAVGRVDLARSARGAAGLSSASHRPPSAAKRLLRREVVDVGLRDVDGQAAGAGGRVDQDERRRRRGWTTGTITPVEVSLCAQATTSQLGSAIGSGRVAGRRPRRRSGRPGTARPRSPWRTCWRTRRSSGAARARARARTPRRPRSAVVPPLPSATS